MENAMRGIQIGDKHTYKDWGMFIHPNTKIYFPEIKEDVIDIKGSDNVIDLSEVLTEDIKFQRRKITIVLTRKEPIQNWKSYTSEIANYLHGRNLEITFDDDNNYYYVGRCLMDPLVCDKRIGKITINVTAEAYKYKKILTTKKVTVSNSLDVSLENSRMRVIPIITSSNDMKAEFEGKTYAIITGKQKIHDIELKEGSNQIKFIGNGNVSIEYREGCL